MTSKATNAIMKQEHSFYEYDGNGRLVAVDKDPRPLCSTYDDNNTIIAVMPSTYSDEYRARHRKLSALGSVLVGIVLAIGLACILL